MAKYRVTVDLITRLSREVDATSSKEAELLAEQMYQEYLKGENAHIVGTKHRQNINVLPDKPVGPVGT